MERRVSSRKIERTNRREKEKVKPSEEEAGALEEVKEKVRESKCECERREIKKRG